MAKGTTFSEFEKGEITVLENLREKCRRPKDAGKTLSSITWKVQKSMEKENRLTA